jgi:GTPase SAR1 family protein
LKFINNITSSEIDNALNAYELMGEISIIPGLLSICGGVLFAGIGVGIGTLGALFSVAGSVTLILGTGGIGLVAIGFGAGFCGLASLFFSQKDKKNNDKSSIKSFEEQIKNKDSLESKILDSFNKLLMPHLDHYLNPMIMNELNKLIDISNKIIFDSSFVVNKLAEKMLSKVKERIQNFHELDKFTILVLGKTGVGKTTLINSILNQDQNGTTIGLPMTMENPQILHTNRELFPTLDIWDSRGLELADEFSIEKSSSQVINFIKNGMKKEGDKKSMNFVHCIWYCVTGTRIEKTEIEYIKKLKNIYSSDKKLPIIFVYTQADKVEYIEGIKKTLMMEINDPNLKFVEVISKEILIKFRKQEIVIGKKRIKNIE